MNIAVYGAGAVGGYLGGMLALAGHKVVLVSRASTAAAIRREGLLITQENVTRRAPVQVEDQLAAALESLPSCDLVIMGMKAYDLVEAVQHLAETNLLPARVMSTQNGIGVEEIIADQFGKERTLAGSVTIPISRRAPNHLLVERSGRGLGIAPVLPGQSVAEWVTMFREADINAGGLTDYRAMKWSKAFLNIMGNASSAILNRPPAELYRQREVFDLEMRMMREALAVMKRLGIDVINLPGATARPLARSLAYAPDFLLQLVFIQVIERGRGDKMPSFHIDLANAKGRSEVVFQNGAIAAAGRAAGIIAPVNAALNDTLLSLARDPGRREYFDRRPDRLLVVVREYERGEVAV